jgi:outer membrane biosynthesis protein TonB
LLAACATGWLAGAVTRPAPAVARGGAVAAAERWDGAGVALTLVDSPHADAERSGDAVTALTVPADGVTAADVAGPAVATSGSGAIVTVESTPTPTATPPPTPSPPPAPTSTPRPSPSRTPTPRPTPAHTPPPTPAPTPAPTPTPTPTPAPTPTPPPPSDTQPPSSTPYSQQQIIDMIRAAAAAHGVNGDCMVALARRESGLNPNAYNPSGPYDGLFQFWPPTYRGPGGTNLWDPRQQSDVAATMMSQGDGPGAWGVSC